MIAFSPTSYVEIALVIFMTFFVGMVVWTFAVRRKHHDAAARIPLSDDPFTPRADVTDGTNP
ncbi:MAG: cbb3-type cytochrome oxidase subunit 3 [Planctomycetota bacterium]|jgi:cbb3-type cytochrome oxidase subunit 3